MANMRLFENDIVRWQLSYYGLLNTRTRWMLLDIEEQLFMDLDASSIPLGERHPCPRQLSFRAFQEFFPAYPVRLSSAELTSAICDGLMFPKPFVNFEKTRLYRLFRDAGYPGERYAVICRWSHQRDVLTSVVLHNCLPPAADNPGCHCCWRLEDGNVVVMQSLVSFVDSVEALEKCESWKTSAVNPDFEEVVESTSSTN